MQTMAAVLVAAEELDSAATRPSPLTSVVFLFLLVALVLLLLSFVRHLRRAQQNLGPARRIPPGAASAGPEVDTEEGSQDQDGAGPRESGPR